MSAVNKFDYFGPIEEEFVRLRGQHLTLNPLDWNLMETWRTMEIPLNVVLRGLNQAFESFKGNGNGRRGQRINSLSYCRQSVERAFGEYRQSQIGAHSETSSSSSEPDQFSKQKILEFLNARYQTLVTNVDASPLRLGLIANAIKLDTIIRKLEDATTVDCAALDLWLTEIDDSLLHEQLRITSKEDLEKIEIEGKAQLKAYKSTMSREAYQQSLTNFSFKRLREIYGIPRLSLFYMI